MFVETHVLPRNNNVVQHRGSVSHNAYKHNGFNDLGAVSQKIPQIINKRHVVSGFGDCIPALAKTHVS